MVEHRPPDAAVAGRYGSRLERDRTQQQAAAATLQVRVESVGSDRSPEDYELVVVIFDGADAEQLGRARRQWSGLKAAGHALTYWAEDANGRWTKQA